MSTNVVLDVLVVGAGGGPLETDLSCYLIKPNRSPWNVGCVALDGGSGLGALTQLLETQPAAFADFGLPTSDPHENAFWILETIRAFCITHAHLDHISGLCIAAGASRSAKHLFATPRTISNIEHVFDGGLWPRLASFSKESATAYLYKHIDPGGSRVSIGAGLQARAMTVSHGKLSDDAYDSTAFFLSVQGSDKEMLFFGDTEPDAISSRPRNKPVWEEAAKLFPQGRLSAVFIECSYTASRPDDLLFGHLSPPYLFDEIHTFAKLVDPSGAVKRPLQGLTVYVTHVKRTPGAFEQVKREIERMAAQQDIGAHFVPVERGMRLEV